MANQFDQLDPNESLEDEPGGPSNQFHPPAPPSLPPSESSAGSTTSSLDAMRETIRRGPQNATERGYANAVDTYTMRRIRRFNEKNLIDYSFWETMNAEFEDYTEHTWSCILPEHWAEIREICLPRGLWIDNPGQAGTRPQCMRRAVQNGDYEWSAANIRWAESRDFSLSPAIMRRKTELQGQAMQERSNSAMIGQSIAPSIEPRTESLNTPQSPTLMVQNSAVQPKSNLPQIVTPGGSDPYSHRPFQQIGLVNQPSQTAKGKGNSDPKQPVNTAPLRRNDRMTLNAQPATVDWLDNQGRATIPSVERPPAIQVQTANQPSGIAGTEGIILHQNATSAFPAASLPPVPPPQSVYQSQPPPIAPSQDARYGNWPPPPPSELRREYNQNPPAPSRQLQDSQAVKTLTYSHELTQLDKVYKDDDKFSGTGDNLDYKLAIFYDKCNRIGLPPEMYGRAASIMLSGQAQTYYYNNRSAMATWPEFVASLRKFFEGTEWNRLNRAKWQTINLADVITANPTLSTADCLRKLITEIDMLQRGIGPEFAGPFYLRENIIRAVRGHPALLIGLTNPPEDVPGLVNSLHSSIVNYEAVHKTPQLGSYVQSYNDEEEEDGEENEAYFVDRHYRGGRSGFRDRGRFYGRQRHAPRRGTRRPFSSQKRCFVCDKIGCWSTNHSQQERDDSKKKFEADRPHVRNQPNYEKAMQRYIYEYEGNSPNEITQYFDQLLLDVAEDETYNSPADSSRNGEPDQQFFTSVGALETRQSSAITEALADYAFKHRVTMEDETVSPPELESYAFNAVTESRYDATEFKGLLIDSGASTKSTGGIGQFKALQKIDDSIKIDYSTAGSANFTFGIGSTASLGQINLETPIGSIIFHIVSVNTPFLLCLADMDKLGVFFNNVTNELVQANSVHPVIRRYGHAFMMWHTSTYSLVSESFDINPCYLTEGELRQLHRRFGHPSVRRLETVLNRAGHDVDPRVLRHLTKYCDACQRNGRSPGRFSFTIKDDVNCNFNFNIIVDILYVTSKPVLHIVDEATRFQTGRWLKEISARHLWEQLRSCWIDTYLGPPDFISADAGKQFIAREFKQYAANMGITVRNVPVEAHHSIGKVERYHGPLRRIYTIIATEIPGIDPELALQMAFKAINDSVGPNGLVPTLLVFGAYPRMTELDAPSPTITQRATAMKKAMEEVKKLTALRQINDALNMRNGPSTVSVHDLPLNSEVLVFREGNAGRAGGWKGPYKFIGLEGEQAIIELPNGPTRFRTTSVKAYNSPADGGWEEDATPHIEDPNSDAQAETTRPSEMAHPDEAIGRSATPEIDDSREQDDPDYTPPSVAAAADQPAKRGRGRPRKHPINVNVMSDICFSMYESFMLDDSESGQFVASRQKEILGLIEKGVFQITDLSQIPINARIFNSRFVDEVKNQGTEKAFEKSRLVVQAYNDINKASVLTQSPTIQRVSQRVILCLAAVLQDRHNKLYLRDVTQAYVQSNSSLNRDFFIRPPPELANMLGASRDDVLKVMKPLYGVPEAGNHWFATYHRHHLEKLGMTESTYDSCFLYSNQPFAMIGLQTDDTLIFAADEFATREEEAIQAAKIMTKPRECLNASHPIKFNGVKIKLESDGSIYLNHESHASVQPVKTYDTSSISSRGIVREKLTPKEQYLAQRARGAYVACICQPEASFDLSYAAQSTDFSSDDIDALNKRLQWQIDNKSKGLKYVQLDRDSLRVVIFTDSSFANNRDLSSQIGYVACLTDSTDTANILHWSSIKCKRVTRSVLASELYAMAHGFDLGAVLKATLSRVLQFDIPMLICTDSKSLYECLVKLGTTHEKRLMIDIMSLRQSYERREITEVRWIRGENNPADSMTKAKASLALKTLVDTNKINLTAFEWVERDAGQKREEKRAFEAS